MAVFDNFPYTNFHELNLDWVIQKVKEMETEFQELKDFVDTAALIEDIQTNQNGTWTSALDADGIAKIPAAGPTTSGTITENEVSALAPVQGVTSPQNGVWSSIVDIYGNAVIPEASGSTEGVISEDQVESLAAAAAPVQNVQTWQDGGWSDAVDATGVAKIQQANGSDRFGIIKIYDDAHIDEEPYMHIYHATDNEAVPVLNEYLQLAEEVLPTGVVTPGTYGTHPTTVSTQHKMPIVTVDTTGRVVNIQETSIDTIQCTSASIAAGLTSYSMSLTSSVLPLVYKNWFYVLGFVKDENYTKGDKYNALVPGTDFTYSWIKQTDDTLTLSIYLTNALSTTAYFRIVGRYAGTSM